MIWKGHGRGRLGLIKFDRRDCGKQENIPVKIADIWTEISTQDIPNRRKKGCQPTEFPQ